MRLIKTTYSIEKDSAKLDEKEAKRLIELSQKEQQESEKMNKQAKNEKDAPHKSSLIESAQTRKTDSQKDKKEGEDALKKAQNEIREAEMNYKIEMHKIENEVANSKKASIDLQDAMIRAAEHDVADSTSMRLAAVASIKAAGLHDSLKTSAAELEHAVQDYKKLVKLKVDSDVNYEMNALGQLESKETQ